MSTIPPDPELRKRFLSSEARHRGFPARLRQAMGDRPVSRVARKAGLDRNTVKGLLRGERVLGPTADTAERLAVVLGVGPGWLLFGWD